jgi:hypothetical protein
VAAATPSSSLNVEAKVETKEIPQEEPVVISKIFGKIKNRPTKEEFQAELLASDMDNMSRAM